MGRSLRGEFAYQTVYRYLAALIDEAQRSGQYRLPSLRTLSRRLRVSLATVQAAYVLLEHEGRVLSVPKSGYFVCRQPVEGAEALPGRTVVPAQPLLEQALFAHERRLSRQRARSATLWEDTGSARLRTALAERYTRSSSQYWRAEDVHLGPDVQTLLETALAPLALHGSTALVATPCCWRLLRALQRAGLQVLDVPLDAAGSPDLDALARLLSRESVRMLVMPSCLGMPLGRLMSQHDQQQIARLLVLHPVWLLENDLDSEHCFGTPPNSRLRDWVDVRWLLVLGSLEASMGAEAPYAYVLSRHPALAEVVAQRGFLLAPLRLQALGQMFAKGEVDAQLGRLRAELHGRMECFCQQLAVQLGEKVIFAMPDGGRTLWVRLRQPVPASGVMAALSGSAVHVLSGTQFSQQERYDSYLALAWLGDQPDALRDALELMGEALELRCGHLIASEG
ncbi:GntR family transcriptional regulator [Pseudomonas putida]